jgi:hypothetical protein
MNSKVPVFYGFKIGKRFMIDILPPRDDKVVFSIGDCEDDPLIEIGCIEKTRESIIQDIRIESLLDDIPDGKFRVLLAKVEASE